jgi:hypothetical protein
MTNIEARRRAQRLRRHYKEQQDYPYVSATIVFLFAILIALLIIELVMP